MIFSTGASLMFTPARRHAEFLRHLSAPLLLYLRAPIVVAIMPAAAAVYRLRLYVAADIFAALLMLIDGRRCASVTPRHAAAA